MLGRQKCRKRAYCCAIRFLGVPHFYKGEPSKPKPNPSYHSRATSKYGGLWDGSGTISLIINIAKGTTDPRVEFIPQVQTQILTKFHLQNLDQASTSKAQRKISLSTKLKLQNLGQT